MSSLKSVLPKYLPTARLTLQLFDYSDAHYSCLLASINTPTAHKNMGDFGITTPTAFDELNFATRLKSDVFLNLTVVDTDVYYLVHLGDETGPLIGGVSLAQRGASLPPDMGWCVLEEYHSNGYATEAAKELLRMLRDDLGIKEIITWPGTRNLPSTEVAKRVGFVPGGVAEDENGEDVVVYVLPGMKLDGNMKLRLYGE